MVLILTAAAVFGFLAGVNYYMSPHKCIYDNNLCNVTYNNGFGYCPYNYYMYGGPGVVVNTDAGQVKGTSWRSRMGKTFWVFLGIPYGEIPMRFEVSRPFPRWKGVRDASRYGPMCTQLDRKTQIISGSEVCLSLNVFTPQINMQQLLPVMVWIDSSLGWQHGSGDKVNPKNFMDERVVLVTFNFRQSALGFLSTEDGEIQGNMGLKDQVLLLMWVKQNIRNFGGDPDRVTIFGQDSGAASVSLHMLSPLTKGMFHRAISQSGTAHCPWAMQKNPSWKAKMLAQMLNCNLSTTKAMADCLRYKSGQEILEAEIKLKTANWNGMEPYGMFGPTVEKVAYKSPAYLPDNPQNLISGAQRVPWIIGFNEQEGRYFVEKVLNSDRLIAEANSGWTRLAPISFLYNDSATPLFSKDGISSQIKMFYFGNNPVSRESWENYTNIYTDRYYMAGTVATIKAHASMSQIFPYYFKYKGDFSYTRMISNDYSYKRAPSHFDELHYLFNWEYSMEPYNTMQNSYMEFSCKFVKLWVSFAETGIPRATWGTTNEWRTMSPLDSFVNWYVIDYDTSMMMDDPWKSKIDFWTKLGIQDWMGL